MYVLWYVLCCYLDVKPLTTTTKGPLRTWSSVDDVTWGDTKTFKHLGQLKEGHWGRILEGFLSISSSLLPVCYEMNLHCHTLSWMILYLTTGLRALS